MANEKTPLRDAVPSTPERAKKTAQRSTVARRRAVVAVVGIVLVVVALFLVFGGNGPNPIANIINPPPPVPEFKFNTVQTAFKATAVGVSKKSQQDAAEGISNHVEKTLTQLIQAGYVDPSTWGDAGAIEGLFTEDAAKQVEPNIDTLTLGTDAGDTYSTMTPRSGTVKITALTDADAKAIRAMATFTFRGTAAAKDGTYTDVEVTGTVFLVPDGNDWKIEAFNLQRNDAPGSAPKASASAASPTESA